MARLDIERQKLLEPERINYALNKIRGLEIDVYLTDKKCIEFYWKGELVKFFPYSGWHTGKSIKDGRGLEKLLKQLK